MIEELRIRSLGVIEEAAIPFGPGLTVLTGETGAGKTMVLTGLSMVMGGRADSTMVRRDAERADVDGRWLLGSHQADSVVATIEDAGGDVDRADGSVQVVLGRSVAASGRSRAFAGGRSVPASVLGAVTAELVTVHGQSDQLQLRDARSQRRLLDRFAGPEFADLLQGFGADLARLRALERERAELVEHRQEREREAVLLRHGIAEIVAVEPEAGEDDALKQRAAMLANATDLLAAMGEAHAALLGGEAGESGVVETLAMARRSLERARALDESVDALVTAVAALIDQVSALGGEVAVYAGSLEADPDELSRVEERRQLIGDLKRRFGPTLDDVLAWWAQAEFTVAEADGTDERLEILEAEIVRLVGRVRSQAQVLTEQRRLAAAGFSERITAELVDLAMPDASVRIEITSTDDLADFTPSGADSVAMLLTPHAGSDPRPLGSGASGGELSRLMLAIEVVLAGARVTPTFVFDEVDAGIGGRVAVEVGRRLSRLARTAQVIVVTHLPQVAAFADAHVVVRKDAAGQVTESSVVPVTGEDRVTELVRMLSGLEGSVSGAEHAAELLQLAEAERSAGGTGPER
jgi:DNA repair protein RecN (Recombination protein N)